MARIITVESIEAPYRCVCSNGVHSWYADEPEYNHGGDTGPSPGELLLSAIGTCATITLRMYAKRKEWQVEKILIDLRLEAVETENGLVNKVHETLTIEGNIDADQYARMKSLLPKCPIAKVVTGRVEIVY